jgi:hypothetical protein
MYTITLIVKGLTMVQAVLISTVIGQVINICLKLIKACMQTQKLMKLLGLMFTIAIILCSWFLIFIKVASMEQVAVNAYVYTFRPTSGHHNF